MTTVVDGTQTPIVGYVVATQWRLVAAIDLLLDEIHSSRDSIIGQDVFAVFPDNPDDPNTNGTQVLRASLEYAVATGHSEKLLRQRYDAPLAEEGGQFQKRYWLPENVPVQDNDGNVIYVIHTVYPRRQLAVPDLRTFVSRPLPVPPPRRAEAADP